MSIYPLSDAVTSVDIALRYHFSGHCFYFIMMDTKILIHETKLPQWTVDWILKIKWINSGMDTKDLILLKSENYNADLFWFILKSPDLVEELTLVFLSSGTAPQQCLQSLS